MMMYPFGMAWGGVWGALWMLLLLALTVLGGVALVRALLPKPRSPDQDDVALDVLRSRYAKGEIDEAEYLHRRANLRHEHQGEPT
ncbi:MAG: SHOCT domain-containing protein [Trueperaceae bacterium]